MKKLFAEYSKKYGLITAGDKIILSISGGADSVCLAHLLGKYRRMFRIEVVLVYFDHGIRPAAEIKKDIKVVKDIAGMYGWDFLIRKIALSGGSSLEEKARKERYRKLLKIAEKMGFNKIMTAHTADDNAETVLMWLLRGTGLKGLAGIPLRRKLSGGVTVVRPLLFFEKNEILDYLDKSGYKYSFDKTNLQGRFFRNRIRNEVIPFIKKFRPTVVRHLNNLSFVLSDLSDKLVDEGKTAFLRCVSDGVLDLKIFFRYNNAIRYEIIGRWLGVRNDFDLFFRINEFLKNDCVARFSVGKHVLKKKDGRVYIS